MTDSKALIDWLQNNAVPVEPNHVIVERAKVTQIINHIKKLEADKALLRGLLREAEVKLTDVQGAYATKRYADNLLARIRAALQETIHD